MWYRDGTYSFEKESTKVTGVGTSWADAKFGVLPGMIMVDADGCLHEIDRVLSNTELLIAEPYTGESVSDVPSRIITTYEGDLSQFSARFSALLKSISTDSRQIRNWLTSSVPVTITRDDGSTFTADSLETIAIDFSENRKWMIENKEVISASADMAKQTAVSAKEAKQAAEIAGQLSEATGEYASSAAHLKAYFGDMTAAQHSIQHANLEKLLVRLDNLSSGFYGGILSKIGSIVVVALIFGLAAWGLKNGIGN